MPIYPPEQLEKIQEQIKRLDEIATAGHAIGLHIRQLTPSLSLQTYPSEWLDQYNRKLMVLSDPVFRWSLRETGIIRWSSITDFDFEGVLDAAAEYGLKYGAAFCYRQDTEFTMAGVSRSDREFTDDEIVALETILNELHHLARPCNKLTRREIDALRAIRNKGKVLGLDITKEEIEPAIRSVRDKLNATSDEEAIRIAEEKGLI